MSEYASAKYAPQVTPLFKFSRLKISVASGMEARTAVLGLRNQGIVGE